MEDFGHAMPSLWVQSRSTARSADMARDIGCRLTDHARPAGQFLTTHITVCSLEAREWSAKTTIGYIEH